MRKFIIRVLIALLVGVLLYQYVKHEYIEPAKTEFNNQIDNLFKSLEIPQ